MGANSPSSLGVNIVHGTPGELTAYLLLNIWPSHFGLPLLVATALFSKNVKRHPTLINMFVVWITIGISSSLLLYAGKTTGPEPSQVLCLIQASFQFSLPTMTSLSVFLLVYQMYRVVSRSCNQNVTHSSDGPMYLFVVLILPWGALVICTIATVLVGVPHPERISRDRRFFYCSLDSSPLTDTSTIIAAVVLISTLVLEAKTVKILWSHWTDLKSRGFRLGGSMEFQHALRTIVFGSYVFIAAVLGIWSVKAPENPTPDLIIACAASVVCLLFGTQPDIFHVWRFWRSGSKDIDRITSTVPSMPLASNGSSSSGSSKDLGLDVV